MNDIPVGLFIASKWPKNKSISELKEEFRGSLLFENGPK
jgi:hypothetical protein